MFLPFSSHPPYKPFHWHATSQESRTHLVWAECWKCSAYRERIHDMFVKDVKKSENKVLRDLYSEKVEAIMKLLT